MLRGSLKVANGVKKQPGSRDKDEDGNMSFEFSEYTPYTTREPINTGQNIGKKLVAQ